MIGTTYNIIKKHAKGYAKGLYEAYKAAKATHSKYSKSYGLKSTYHQIRTANKTEEMREEGLLPKSSPVTIAGVGAAETGARIAPVGETTKERYTEEEILTI